MEGCELRRRVWRTLSIRRYDRLSPGTILLRQHDQVRKNPQGRRLHLLVRQNLQENGRDVSSRMPQRSRRRMSQGRKMLERCTLCLIGLQARGAQGQTGNVVVRPILQAPRGTLSQAMHGRYRHRMRKGRRGKRHDVLRHERRGPGMQRDRRGHQGTHRPRQPVVRLVLESRPRGLSQEVSGGYRRGVRCGHDMLRFDGERADDL
mmetsp:Transcript_45477/g.95470  ORF Transcript_45477/g.95470 Transcript_45477/m.95470 type:complete len:205 (-) Transcript_45477:708-1322(-)